MHNIQYTLNTMLGTLLYVVAKHSVYSSTTRSKLHILSACLTSIHRVSKKAVFNKPTQYMCRLKIVHTVYMF